MSAYLVLLSQSIKSNPSIHLIWISKVIECDATWFTKLCKLHATKCSPSVKKQGNYLQNISVKKKKTAQKMPATQFMLKSCMSELAKCVCGCILETNKNHEASSLRHPETTNISMLQRSGLTSLKRNQQSPYFDSQPFHVSNQIRRWLPSLKLT